MCIIAIAYRVHPAYPLVIASNRDEFYDRPTAPLEYWDTHPEILAGRDLKSFGTWLGVNKNGKIAAVTNYREPSATNNAGKSRGALVFDFLADDIPADAYLKRIEDQKNKFNGFNLIAGTVNGLFWYSNRNSGITALSPGIQAISNNLLNTPWPKVEKIRQGFSAIIRNDTPIDPDTLFDLLKDQSRPPDAQLPDTGIGKTWEKVLSPVFIKSEIYGTRCSSVILIDNAGNVLFCERTFEAGETAFTRCFDFISADP